MERPSLLNWCKLYADIVGISSLRLQLGEEWSTQRLFQIRVCQQLGQVRVYEELTVDATLRHWRTQPTMFSNS
jgi:hypothetical protein